MSWILWVLLLLFLLPLLLLSIPVRVQFYWNSSQSGYKWSVHYGQILIAPGGKEAAVATMNRFKRRFKWILTFLNWILQAIKWLIGGLILIVRYPFVLLSKLKKQKTSTREYREPEESDDLIWEEPSEPFSSEPPLEKERGEAGPPWEEHGKQPPGHSSYSHPDPVEDDLGIDDNKLDDDSEFENDAQINTPKTDLSIPRFFQILEQLREYLNKLSETVDKKNRERISRLTKLLDNLERFSLYAGLFLKHKRVLRRTFKVFLKLLKRLLKAFNFRILRGEFVTGGDPSVLGSSLGWYHALDGAAGGKLVQHLTFLPDFEEHSFSPRGEATVDLRLRVIHLIWPVVFMLFSLPYYSYYRVYRDLKEESVL